MRDLAPHVARQRLLIEATYERTLEKKDVEDFLRQLPVALGLRIYQAPIVYSPGGEGKEINQGYDGFVALVESGISIYVWENAKFLSIVVYSCKAFDEKKAIHLTRSFFDTRDLEQMSF